MKAILLFFTLSFSIPAYCQYAPAGTKDINLRLNEKPKVLRKGDGRLLLGGAFSVAGLGLALLGPMLINTPGDPTPQYLNDVRLAGDNTAAADVISGKYQKDYSEYSKDLENKRRRGNGLKIFGAGLFSVGIVLNIDGILDLTENPQKP